MNYILADKNRENLLPFTYTRPVAEIRMGILTIAEKWERYLNTTLSYLTQDYLQEKYPLVVAQDNLVISASYLPNLQLLQKIDSLQAGQALINQDEVIAYRTSNPIKKFDKESFVKFVVELLGDRIAGIIHTINDS